MTAVLAVNDWERTRRRRRRQLVVPVDVLFVCVEFQVFLHSRLPQGVQHYLLLGGREDGFALASFKIWVAAEALRQQAHEPLVLVGIHPPLHPGEASGVGHRGSVAEVRAGTRRRPSGISRGLSRSAFRISLSAPRRPRGAGSARLAGSRRAGRGGNAAALPYISSSA